MTVTRRGLLAGLVALVTGACARQDSSSGGSPSGGAGAVRSTVSTSSSAVPTVSSIAVPSTPTPTTTPATTTVTTAAAVGPARFVAHGDRSGDRVALSFHGAGDPEMAARMLDGLTRAGPACTIFAVGSWLEENPGLAPRILDGGHELANHTYTHPSLGELDAVAVSEEIDRCRAVLAAQVGPAGLRWFRPSAMVEPTELVLQRAGRSGYATVVGYDVDSLDFQDPGSAAIVSNVAVGLQPGSIVSLHLGHQGTVDALPGLLQALRDAKLRPVTVSTLLGG